MGGVSHTSVATFDKTTGALTTTFAPSVNGDVNAVVPGPTTNTVYIGGAFTTVNGVATQFVALLDTTTGALVSAFKAPKFNFGYVNDMVARGNRLYVAGTFTVVGGKPHSGLVALNATTGALDPFINNQFTGHHNDSGSGAQGWVGPWDIDVTADGSTMIVIGNFKYVDGQLRDQAAMLDLRGDQLGAANWSTARYQPYCYNWAFDSYVRGVSFSPDGSYFVINATGGGNNTLCDSTARFETDLNAANAQPTWVNETGGDTVWGVTVTNSAVYIGGHNRWSNNPDGVDQAQPGAVPRPGLGALDPVSGRPFVWNPGRKPLGVAVFAVYASPEGLWIGSNTDWVGNFQYKRPKLAFFPYQGGYAPTLRTSNSLPATVYLAGSRAVGSSSNVLYRVDAGGPAIQSLDSGPDWSADTSDPSAYRNTGSNAAGYSTGETVDSTVPASTPTGIFESERWSPSDNPPMQWAFPAPVGAPLQVRLYFANRCTCTSSPGARSFDVAIDGTRVLDHYDIVSSVGDQTGTMSAFNITSDGTVNIDFSHEVENPLINGIEIVRTDQPAPGPASTDSLNTVAFDGTNATASNADNQGVDFGNWRGAVQIGGKVFYGYTDGYLYSRSLSGGKLGPATKIDPYNDAFWSDIDSDDGTTFRGHGADLVQPDPEHHGHGLRRRQAVLHAVR